MTQITDKERIAAVTAFIADVATKLRDRSDVIVDRYFPTPAYISGKTIRTGNIKNDPGDSFVFHFAGPKRGYSLDYNGGERCDALQIVAEREGMTLYEAAKFAADSLLGEPVKPLPTSGDRSYGRHADEDNDDGVEKAKKAAKAVYGMGVDYPHTLAERYFLEERQVTLPRTCELRYQADCWYKPKPTDQNEDPPVEKHPAALLPVRDFAGEFRGVGKYFLTKDGRLNRELDKAKAVRGDNYGNSVHLSGPVTNIRFLGEGYEDAATFKMYVPDLFGHATLGGSNLQNFQFPSDAIDILIVLEDNDPRDENGKRTGQGDRRKFFARVQAEIRTGQRRPVTLVNLPMPRQYKDLNQFHREAGPSVVAAYLRRRLGYHIDPEFIVTPSI